MKRTNALMVFAANLRPWKWNFAVKIQLHSIRYICIYRLLTNSYQRCIFFNSFLILIHLLNLHEVGRQMRSNVRFAYLVLRIRCSFSKRGTTPAFAVGHCRLFILQGLQLQPAAHLVHFVHRCKLQWCKIRVQNDVYLTWEFPEGLHGVFGPWTEPGQAFKVCFLQVRSLPALPWIRKIHMVLTQSLILPWGKRTTALIFWHTLSWTWVPVLPLQRPAKCEACVQFQSVSDAEHPT